MKKIQLLLIAVLFVVTANAQLFNIAGVGVGYFYAGPKLGLNGAFMTIDELSGFEKKANLGYQFGAVAKIGITDKLSIQPELLYTSKGYKQNSTSSDFTTRGEYKYIGLPVLAKYAFIAFSDIQVYAAGGYYIDVLTGVTSISESKTNDFNEVWTETSLEPYRRVDFGFNVGAGIEKEFVNEDKLNLDLNFTLGTVDIDKQGNSSSSKNITVQLSAIYLFDMTRWISFGGEKKTKGTDAYEENNAPVGGSKVD